MLNERVSGVGLEHTPGDLHGSVVPGPAPSGDRLVGCGPTDDTRRNENALSTNRNAETLKNKLHDQRYCPVSALFSRHHHYIPNLSARHGRYSTSNSDITGGGWA